MVTIFFLLMASVTITAILVTYHYWTQYTSVYTYFQAAGNLTRWESSFLAIKSSADRPVFAYQYAVRFLLSPTAYSGLHNQLLTDLSNLNHSPAGTANVNGISRNWTTYHGVSGDLTEIKFELRWDRLSDIVVELFASAVFLAFYLYQIAIGVFDGSVVPPRGLYSSLSTLGLGLVKAVLAQIHRHGARGKRDQRIFRPELPISIYMPRDKVIQEQIHLLTERMVQKERTLKRSMRSLGAPVKFCTDKDSFLIEAVQNTLYWERVQQDLVESTLANKEESALILCPFMRLARNVFFQIYVQIPAVVSLYWLIPPQLKDSIADELVWMYCIFLQVFIRLGICWISFKFKKIADIDDGKTGEDIMNWGLGQIIAVILLITPVISWLQVSSSRSKSQPRAHAWYSSSLNAGHWRHIAFNESTRKISKYLRVPLLASYLAS